MYCFLSIDYDLVVQALDNYAICRVDAYSSYRRVFTHLKQKKTPISIHNIISCNEWDKIQKLSNSEGQSFPPNFECIKKYTNIDYYQHGVTYLDRITFDHREELDEIDDHLQQLVRSKKQLVKVGQQVMVDIRAARFVEIYTSDNNDNLYEYVLEWVDLTDSQIL